ncbi:MAG: hypothetical protein P1U80_03520 [Pseudomonadales bacterium]|nr:hypothetical protein [Pseudomonadales bacterium]
MGRLERARFLLRITHGHLVLRRYFVVNGFDGALTMMGLILGFLVSTPADLAVIINACLGAAIALGMSGFSSAYISESAERRRALGQLEKAMISDLQESTHGQAARLTPLLVALVNGLAPLIISLLILMPLWLGSLGVPLPVSPLYAAILVALMLIFLLGVFLGRVADISWLRSGLQTLLVAVATATLIYLFVGD